MENKKLIGYILKKQQEILSKYPCEPTDIWDEALFNEGYLKGQKDILKELLPLLLQQESEHIAEEVQE